MKAIVLGGSRGIGRAIASGLENIKCEVSSYSSTEVDTGNLTHIQKLVDEHDEGVDILVLNTGGPPAVEFEKITIEMWEKYHKQMFLGFCYLLQNIKIKQTKSIIQIIYIIYIYFCKTYIRIISWLSNHLYINICDDSIIRQYILILSINIINIHVDPNFTIRSSQPK